MLVDPSSLAREQLESYAPGVVFLQEYLQYLQ